MINLNVKKMNKNKLNRRAFIGKTTTSMFALSCFSDAIISPIRMSKEKKALKLNAKIIALQSSPRKGGNTDVLVDNILKTIENENIPTEKIYLFDYDIQSCIMCDGCKSEETPYCILDDDFNELIKYILNAEILILSTPVYWGNVSGKMKTFMERCYSLFDSEWINSKFEGKSSVIVVCCGGDDIPHETKSVLHSLEMILRMSQVTLLDKLLASANLKGDIYKNESALKEAGEIGMKLVKVIND